MEQTTNEMVHKLKDAAGIITETGDRYSHAAVVGMTLEIPVITSARKCDQNPQVWNICDYGCRTGNRI